MDNWKKVESLLFASGKYLSEEYISNVTELKGKQLKEALKKLEEHYEGADTSLKVFREGDQWKLNVKEEYSGIVNKIIAETELPNYVMATLAVIAYKSPVLQSEVIDMRGSNAYEHIKMLEEKGFIKKEKHGRTYKLKVSDKFFEYFDVKSEADIQEVFKDVKKPEKLGGLQVYDASEEDNNNEFSEKITDRMKKVEKKESEEDEHKSFLEGFEEKISKVKGDLDEAEKELQGMRPGHEAKSLLDDDETEEEPFQSAEPEENQVEEKKEEEQEKPERSTEDFIKKINKDIDRISGEDKKED